jgi:uncharacterized membrane protein
MQITPVIAIHMAAALAALAIGPLALWARRSRAQRPRLHRAAGYAWVTLMVMVAVSAVFISGDKGPRLAGFGLIHLLVPITLGFIALSFHFLVRGNVKAHRRIMQGTYIGSCLVAGAFTLLPNRLLGQWLWSQVGIL